MLGLEKDSVTLYPYDEKWAIEFKKEKDILKSLLQDFNLEIIHVGSTSIPGLSAKPIIDIAIGCKDINEVIKVGNVLEKENYEMLDEVQTKKQMLAVKGTPTFRTHHIHIIPKHSEYWNNFVYFKQYLLDHPVEIENYENLKKELSIKYANERKKYTASKSEFIKDILEKSYKLYKL